MTICQQAEKQEENKSQFFDIFSAINNKKMSNFDESNYILFMKKFTLLTMLLLSLFSCSSNQKETTSMPAEAYPVDPTGLPYVDAKVLIDLAKNQEYKRLEIFIDSIQKKDADYQNNLWGNYSTFASNDKAIRVNPNKGKVEYPKYPIHNTFVDAKILFDMTNDCQYEKMTIFLDSLNKIQDQVYQSFIWKDYSNFLTLPIFNIEK